MVREIGPEPEPVRGNRLKPELVRVQEPPGLEVDEELRFGPFFDDNGRYVRGDPEYDFEIRHFRE